MNNLEKYQFSRVGDPPLDRNPIAVKVPKEVKQEWDKLPEQKVELLRESIVNIIQQLGVKNLE